MRLHLLAPAVLLLILSGCSSDGNDDSDDPGDGAVLAPGSPPVTEESPMPAAPGQALVGRWTLRGYALDDGISRTVPDEVAVGIDVRSDATLEVQHDLCGSYEVTYLVDDGILTTTDAVFPDVACAGEYADPDASGRGALLERALLNTQTMVAVSEDGSGADTLTVTTGNNEVLAFGRAPGSVGTSTSGGDPDVALDVALLERTVWLLASRRTVDGLVVPTEGDLRSITLEFDPEDVDGSGLSFLSGNLECNGYSRDYELSGATLEAGAASVSDDVCDGSTASSAAPFFVDTFLLGRTFTIGTANGELTVDAADGRRLTFVDGASVGG